MTARFPRYAAALFALLAAAAFAAPPSISLRTVVANGLEFPVEIAHANDGSRRLFIVEQAGRIRIVKDGALLPTPFLDITSLALFDGGERGLLGLAFHPRYAANRKFYVFYTREGNGALQISEFVANAANPDIAETAERRIITVLHPNAGNHNGGRIAFGPDGYLYIATGDGGGGGDPQDNGQNTGSLLGKLLRVDIDGDAFPADANRNYAIPTTNPFDGVTGAREIWAYGLRNPWKFSFDRLTGDLFIADVGQSSREEVNFEPAGSTGGRNYGWDDMEGSLCHEPTSGCLTAGRVLPIIEYGRNVGRTIIGGYVYRGRRSAALRGFYVYGDLFNANMFAAFPNGDGSWTSFTLGAGPGGITAFGEDEAGELYVVNYNNGSLHAIDGPDDRLTRFDLNADGYADVLWRNLQSGENYAYLMNGRTIEAEGFLRTVADLAWKIVALGDFDGNGKTDILWRNSSTGENYIYLMDGASIAGEGFIRTVVDQSWTVAGAGDFNGDGRDDIFWRNVSTGENYIYPMNGLTILPGEGYVRTVASQEWRIAAIGDADGDGRADVVWRNSATGENYVYPMLGFAIKPSEGYLRTVADQNWQIAGLGDLNGDAKGDLVWRNGATGENYVYVLSTNTIVSEGYLRTVANLDWRIVHVADFDGDGKCDILWRNSSSGENYLYPMDGITIKPTEGFLRTVADQNWKVVGAAGP